MKEHTLTIDGDSNVYRAGIGMSQHVGEGLLQSPEEGKLCFSGQRGKGRGNREPRLNAAAITEVSHERAQCGQQPQIVQQGWPEVVGDAADTPNTGIDERQYVVQPVCLARLSRVAQNSELHLHRRKHLRSLVVQLAREPAALLLVLLDHPGGESCQLDRAGLEPAIEIGIFQRGSDLMAKGKQEGVIQRCERVASMSDQYQRGHHTLVAQDGKECGVGVRRATRRGVGPIAAELRATGLNHPGQHRGAGGRNWALGPVGACAGPADESPAPRPYHVKRTATNRRQRQGTCQERVQHILLQAGMLQVS